MTFHYLTVQGVSVYIHVTGPVYRHPASLCEKCGAGTFVANK